MSLCAQIIRKPFRLPPFHHIETLLHTGKPERNSENGTNLLPLKVSTSSIKTIDKEAMDETHFLIFIMFSLEFLISVSPSQLPT